MNSNQPSPRLDNPTTYQIRVHGRLDESWSDWLGKMAITFERRIDRVDITTLTGVVVDQAALFGILNRIRDLNLPLLSVQLVNPET